jgi:septal ring factor EnvC (AmiA/AmiB activator)
MFTAGIEYNKTISMVTAVCCQCGIPFGMPSDFKEVCQQDSNKWFYCPNGHSQHYSETTEQKLRKQLDLERGKLAQKVTESIQLENQLDKVNKKLKRTEKRIANGVCPCCNRTFKDLAAHIQTKHPDYMDK